jgi:hypothetical protein
MSQTKQTNAKRFPIFMTAAMTMAGMLIGGSILNAEAASHAKQTQEIAEQSARVEADGKANAKINQNLLKHASTAQETITAGNLDVHDTKGHQVRVGNMSITYHVDPAAGSKDPIQRDAIRHTKISTDGQTGQISHLAQEDIDFAAYEAVRPMFFSQNFQSLKESPREFEALYLKNLQKRLDRSQNGNNILVVDSVHIDRACIFVDNAKTDCYEGGDTGHKFKGTLDARRLKQLEQIQAQAQASREIAPACPKGFVCG